MGELNFTPFPELTTERLSLRQLRATDKEDVFLLRSDEVVNRYIDRPRQKTIAEAADFIAWINTGIQRDRWLYWAIAWKNDDRLLGTICLWNFSRDGRRADIGYEMNPAFFGQGIMHEAMKAVLSLGFHTLGLETIEAYTRWDNDRSTRLLLRHHFVLVEGRKDPHNEAHVVFKLDRFMSV